MTTITSSRQKDAGSRAPALLSFAGEILVLVVVLQCRSKGNISWGGGARERRRREPLGGSAGMFPQKILKSRGLEMLFPAFSKSYL